MASARTPKGTTHVPTRRRTLSGKYLDKGHEGLPSWLDAVGPDLSFGAHLLEEHPSRKHDVPRAEPVFSEIPRTHQARLRRRVRRAIARAAARQR